VERSFGLPLENSTIGPLGKNPSDVHVAATGAIMRFVGNNGQVCYDNLHKGWENIFYRGGRATLKTLLLLGTAFVAFVCFSYNLRFKI